MFVLSGRVRWLSILGVARFEIEFLFKFKGFHPRGPEFNPQGRLDPSVALRAVFPRGSPSSAKGRLPLSVEEAFLRMIAGRAADPTTGRGAFDSTLPVSAVKGAIVRQMERLIAFHAICGTASARVASLRRAQRA